MKSPRLRALAMLVLLTLLGAGLVELRAPGSVQALFSEAPEPGGLAPGFELRRRGSGETLRLQDVAAPTVIVVAYSASCGACEPVLELAAQWARRAEPSEVAVLAVDVGWSPDRKALPAPLEAHEATASFRRGYPCDAVPRTWVIEEGRVAAAGNTLDGLRTPDGRAWTPGEARVAR